MCRGLCTSWWFMYSPLQINSLASWRCGCNFKSVIFKIKSQKDILSILCEIALIWIPQELTDKLTLIEVMAWCHQATCHYLNQCWPSSMSPYSITRPQWVNDDYWLIFMFSLQEFPSPKREDTSFIRKLVRASKRRKHNNTHHRSVSPHQSPQRGGSEWKVPFTDGLFLPEYPVKGDVEHSDFEVSEKIFYSISS